MSQTDEDSEDYDEIIQDKAKRIAIIINQLFFKANIIPFKETHGFAKFTVINYEDALVVEEKNNIKYLNRLDQLLSDIPGLKYEYADDAIILEAENVNIFIEYLEKLLIDKAREKPSASIYSFFSNKDFVEQIEQLNLMISLGYNGNDIEKLCGVPSGSIANINVNVIAESLSIVCADIQITKIVKEKLESVFQEKFPQRKTALKIQAYNDEDDLSPTPESKKKVCIAFDLQAYKYLLEILSAQSPHRARKHLGFG